LVIEKLREEGGDDDLTRQPMLRDCRRAIKETQSVVVTGEDSKVLRILQSYFAYVEGAHEIKVLLQQYNENAEKQLHA